MSQRDRVALVTGAGRSVGQAVAYRLHEMGCAVVACARTQEEIDHTVGVIQEQGGRSAAVRCDVGDADDVERAVEAARKVFGRIDYLVNSAGTYFSKPILDTSVEDFEQAVRANLRGPFLLTRGVIPQFRRQGGGRIVNVASLFGVIPGNNMALYSAVKSGLIGFTLALSRELHNEGINVNAVCPGAISTGEKDIELEETRQALGKQLLPRDVADAVAFLLTDDSSQITGATIEIPGNTSTTIAQVTP